MSKPNIYDIQAAQNQKFSTQTAFEYWLDEFHCPMYSTHQEYRDTFEDMDDMIRTWAVETGVMARTDFKFDPSLFTRHILYKLSTCPTETMSMATMASTLEHLDKSICDDWGDRVGLMADLIVAIEGSDTFTYYITQDHAYVIQPTITIGEVLQANLDARLKAPMPQMASTVGTLTKEGTGLIPGLRVTGKSTVRKLPLNQASKDFVTQLSRMAFDYDYLLAQSVQYAVPTITDEGVILTEKEREDCRAVWHRFLSSLHLAASYGENIAFPHVLDSRGRMYSGNNCPIARNTLLSVKATGNLSNFEKGLLQ